MNEYKYITVYVNTWTTCTLTSEINVSVIELFSVRMDNVINKPSCHLSVLLL